MDMPLVLFDLDGTLADTLADIAAAMNRVLAARGFATYETGAYRRFVGDGVEMLARRTVPKSALDLAPVLADEFRRDYGEHMLDDTRPYDGVPAMLDDLAQLGARMAIISNKPHAATRFMAAKLLARWSFLAVHGARSDWPLKPDPSLSLAVAAEAGVPPARCLFVGDSNVDMATGEAAGMHPVGVLWGFRDREELVASGAEAVIAEPGELPPLLANLLGG